LDASREIGSSNRGIQLNGFVLDLSNLVVTQVARDGHWKNYAAYDLEI
jgi:hypothetical protein